MEHAAMFQSIDGTRRAYPGHPFIYNGFEYIVGYNHQKHELICAIVNKYKNCVTVGLVHPINKLSPETCAALHIYFRSDIKLPLNDYLKMVLCH